MLVSLSLQRSLLISPDLHWSPRVSVGLSVWSPLVSSGLPWSPVVCWSAWVSPGFLGLCWSPVFRGLCWYSNTFGWLFRMTWSPVVSPGLLGLCWSPWSSGVSLLSNQLRSICSSIFVTRLVKMNRIPRSEVHVLHRNLFPQCYMQSKSNMGV